MKVSVNLTIEIDPDQWAHYNDVERSEVREDVRKYILNYAQCAPRIEESDGTASLRN